MPRPIRNLTDMEIDEISTVDKAANQFSRFVIAKRAPEEEEMPKLFNQEGQPLDEQDLEFGDIVYDDQGQAYEYVEDEGEDEPQPEQEEGVKQPELAGVGKSAFFEKQAPKTGSFTQSVLEELSKAFSDGDRDKVIAKALGRVEELENQFQTVAKAAQAERDLRLTREYVSKAAEYNLPFAPLARFKEQCDRVKSACEEIGRDPGSIVHSAALVLCCGKDDAEVERRAEAIGRDVDELRKNGAAGTPGEVVETLQRWQDAGAERMYLQMLDLSDLDHLSLIAADVAPQLS